MARFAVLVSLVILLIGVALALPIRDPYCVFPTAKLARYLAPRFLKGGFHLRAQFDAFQQTSDIPVPWAASMIPIIGVASFQSPAPL
jgi:hypothetical protein